MEKNKIKNATKIDLLNTYIMVIYVNDIVAFFVIDVAQYKKRYKKMQNT